MIEWELENEAQEKMGYLGLAFICLVLLIAYFFHWASNQKHEQQDTEEKKEPIILVHDSTKLKPWCVMKWNGRKYEQATGWFAKEENARIVYERLKEENPPSLE